MVTVAFLNVGQGDSTVIILPSKGKAHLIDCPLNHPRTVLAYLAKNDIEALETIFITHSDLDHLGGIPRVVEDFNVVNSIAWNLDRTDIRNRLRKAKLMNLLNLHKERSIKRFEPRANTVDTTEFANEDVKLTVLHPTDNALSEAALVNDANNASIVLKLEYAQKHVLFPGDLMLRGWQRIVEENIDVSADILKYPHHGAWYQANPEYDLEEVFLRVSPQFTVISTGTSNNYEHPNVNSLKMLRAHNASFLCTQATERCCQSLAPLTQATSCAGTIEVAIQADGKISISPEHKPHPSCN